MRFIAKGHAPSALGRWLAGANADWQPTYKDLRDPEKRELHLSLLIEQNFRCCYCGGAINLENSHIEHFRPQALRSDLALSYENLHASCIRETSPTLPLHCGHAKGNRFDEGKCISPCEEGCVDRFAYTLTGEILPTRDGDEQACFMVDVLRLDEAFLRNRRGKALSSVFDPVFVSTMTVQDLAQLRDEFGRRESHSDDSVDEFSHVLYRYAKRFLETI